MRCVRLKRLPKSAIRQWETKDLRLKFRLPVIATQPQSTAASQPVGADSALDAPLQAQALYLHLPFCFHKCHYCDFYSVVDNPAPRPGTAHTAPQTPSHAAPTDRQPAFTRALIAELHAAHRAAPGPGLRPRTVFAGGGTPTFLRPALWDQLLAALHRDGTLERTTEFTVEANPETVTPDLMKRLADGGVNRVSIGAQSFQKSSLDALERWHRPESVRSAVDACRAAGLTNLSLDLIFAIPGQTLAMLDDDLDRLLELEPTHLSTYGLTYEPQTPLTARLRVGRVTKVDEDTERAMYARVLERLEGAGFEHYEVSNWARATPDHRHRCAHNLAYWTNANWQGLGPGAASHHNGHRWRNAPNLTRYLAHWDPDHAASPTGSSPASAPPTEDHERLAPEDRIGERLMLGLRLSDGIERAWVHANVPADHRRAAAIDELIAIGMLEHTATHLRLTRRGLFVADSVVAKLL